MNELRGKVAELRGELEAFGTGVVSRVKPLRNELNTLTGKLEGVLASLRPEVEAVAGGLSKKIDALDAELAELEP